DHERDQLLEIGVAGLPMDLAEPLGADGLDGCLPRVLRARHAALARTPRAGDTCVVEIARELDRLRVDLRPRFVRRHAELEHLLVVLTRSGSATADGLYLYENTDTSPRALIPASNDNPMDEV